MHKNATREEELAEEIRRSCRIAEQAADTVCIREKAAHLDPSYENTRTLAKARGRLAYALAELNTPIRLYHEAVGTRGKPTLFQRFIRWLATCAARGSAFRRRS